MKVKRLKPGDTIGFICPSFTCQMNTDRISNLKQIIKKLGYHLKFGSSCFKSYGYLAGSDEERIKDLKSMFLDDDIKAIICLKGGYGASRIVDKIDYDIIKKNPKVFMGFSDITILLNAIYQKTNLPTIHGQLGIYLGRNDLDEISINDFKSLLNNDFKNRTLTSPHLRAINEGIAKGKMVGGNLSLITNLIGTPYDIDFKDKIVFIEEVDESPYRVDRMFSQLRLSGKIHQARGFVFGYFTNCISENKDTQTIEDLIYEYFKTANKPIIVNFSSGHDLPFINLPIGLEVEINTYEMQIKVKEGYYEEN